VFFAHIGPKKQVGIFWCGSYWVCSLHHLQGYLFFLNYLARKKAHNKRIKHGTANSLLGSALLHILANNYQPLMRALAFSIQGLVMNPKRLERIIVGTFIPPILGGFLFYVYMMLVNTQEIMDSSLNFATMNFTDLAAYIVEFIGRLLVIIIFTLAFFGIQSVLYSLIMELAVQKISSDKLVIFISMLLGVLVASLFVSFVGFNVSIIGGIVGLLVGQHLRTHFKAS
jgi:ABC-type multidrug transport system permease subunit